MTSVPKPEAPTPLEKAWPLIWAVERAYEHGNLEGDLLDAWLEYSRAEADKLEQPTP